MKRIISILLILCMLSVLLISCGSNDDTNPDDDKQTLISQYSKGLAFEVSEKNPSECIITGIGSCTDENIVIPATINGMRVVGIKDGAFSPKTQIAKGVKVAEVLAEEVTDTMINGSISSSNNGGIIFDQFQSSNQGNLGGLYQPVINGEKYETGTGTPIDLEKIESIKIPYTVKEIGEEAFYGCEELDSISTHASLSAIGKDAFKETEYYNNPQNWDGQALYLSNYLITVNYEFAGEFTIKEGTTMVADQAFYNCTYITTVNASSTLTTVGSFAFYGCTGLTNFNISENAVTYTYGAGVFDGCTNIQFKPYLPGNGNNTPDYNDSVQVEEKYPSRFDKIEKDQFDNVKQNIYSNYSVETKNNQTYEKEIIWIDGANYYYTLSKDGKITREMYGIKDENGVVAYMNVDHKIYRTTAEIPDRMAIVRELEFEDLRLYDMEACTYAYLIDGSDESRIEFGFKDGKRLVYMKVVTPDAQITTYFYDFDKTNAPSLPEGDLVPDVIVDENGNRT